MIAKIEPGNGTVISLDGTPEEIVEVYIQMLQGIVELHEWMSEEHEQDEPEEAEPVMPDVPVLRDETIDRLLDYISMIRGRQNGGNQDGTTGHGSQDGTKE